MILIHRAIDKPLILCLLFFSAGCASREIDRLQGSVTDLQSKLNYYQVQTARESQEANMTLGEVNQSISNLFNEFRMSQNSMQSSIVRIETQLAQLEQSVALLQNHNSQMETFVTEVANLTQANRRDMDVMQQQVNQMVERLNLLTNALNETRSQVNAIQGQTADNLSRLRNEISALESQVARSRSAPSGPSLGGGSTGSGNVHVVQPGETLSRIAAKYGASARQLQDLNGVEDPSKIYVGQKLRLP